MVDEFNLSQDYSIEYKTTRLVINIGAIGGGIIMNKTLLLRGFA